MIVLGVDPGKSGGLALLRNQKFLDGIRMPLVKQGQKRDIVDPLAIERWINNTASPDVVVIELVGAMPGQGVRSMFNFGRHVGVVEGLALASGLPINWSTPAAWKRRMGLSKDKWASLDAARFHFGDASRWGVLANDGIAEAALMALDWARHFGQQH